MQLLQANCNWIIHNTCLVQPSISGVNRLQRHISFLHFITNVFTFRMIYASGRLVQGLPSSQVWWLVMGLHRYNCHVNAEVKSLTCCASRCAAFFLSARNQQCPDSLRILFITTHIDSQDSFLGSLTKKEKLYEYALIAPQTDRISHVSTGDLSWCCHRASGHNAAMDKTNTCCNQWIYRRGNTFWRHTQQTDCKIIYARQQEFYCAYRDSSLDGLQRLWARQCYSAVTNFCLIWLLQVNTCHHRRLLIRYRKSGKFADSMIMSIRYFWYITLNPPSPCDANSRTVFFQCVMAKEAESCFKLGLTQNTELGPKLG